MKKLASSRRAVSDPSDRLTEVLSSGHDARTRIRLLRAVEDVSPIVAKRALKRLAEVGGPDEAKRLRELLFALDLAVIPACVQTLIALGDDISGGVAVKELSSSLNDIRLKAALVLREVANPSSAPALRATLQDPLANVRRVALEALACIPDDGKNLAAALDLADDEDETVRAALVRAVVALDVNPGPTLACFLEDPAAAVRLALARNTASLSAGAISLLLEDGNYDVRSQTLWSLVEEPRPELADAIVTRLEDNHWAVRRAACRALGAAEAEGAFRPLLCHLVDSSSIVREAALRALHEIFEDDLPLLLRSAALTEREPGLRRRIVYAIGKTTRGDLAGLVEPFAADSDADVRLAVVRVLTDRPQTNRNGILKELAKDGDLAVRQAARFLLGVPGD